MQPAVVTLSFLPGLCLYDLCEVRIAGSGHLQACYTFNLKIIWCYHFKLKIMHSNKNNTVLYLQPKNYMVLCLFKLK